MVGSDLSRVEHMGAQAMATVPSLPLFNVLNILLFRVMPTFKLRFIMLNLGKDL